MGTALVIFLMDMDSVPSEPHFFLNDGSQFSTTPCSIRYYVYVDFN